MIWVIGDIHGMFDALKRLVTTILSLERDDEKVEKIIFIGDYLDHGPASKEVVDYIVGLDFKTICLAGNHEDMALRFIRQDKKFFAESDNIWFGNGALDTYKSMFDRHDDAEFISELTVRLETYLLSGQGTTLNAYSGLELPKKYENFLKNLAYSHREVFSVDGAELAFTFCHALPDPRRPLEEQRFKNYRDFSKSLAKKSKKKPPKRLASSIFGEDSYLGRLEASCLWRRDYDSDVGYGGEIVVHGHTPTLSYPRYFGRNNRSNLANQTALFDPEKLLPFLYSLSSEAGYQAAANYKGEPLPKRPADYGPYGGAANSCRYACPAEAGVEAINIDTGAVYGGALTALGLSSKRLSLGLMPLITVQTSGGQRQSRNKAFLRTLAIDKLGGSKPGDPKPGEPVVHFENVEIIE
ncbi:MAG: metallophosphoesterase [Deltaproteobacteria bacterium]|jgi:hypothetical protein|nr:metallophosphoesterase [Deltaproteobacteria bacterium]